MDSALLIETWAAIKPYISAKERLHVADVLVRIFDDFGASEGIDEEEGLDKILRAAVASYYHLEDDEEVEEEEYDDR